MSTSIAPRAVILAAGLGSRLRPFTNELPKPLVPVHGIPILHNALRNLASAGVRHATLVVGYRSEAIRRSCRQEFADIQLSYVESSQFDCTGSAYSLWLARETLLAGDVLLVEGDVFFEQSVLNRVLHSRCDVAALARFDETMSGSAVLLSSSGHIAEFRMNQTAASLDGTSLYKTVNLYHFTADTLRNALVPALEELIASGNSRAYVEQLLALLVARRSIHLQAALCDDARWFEIDNEADLRIAERLFASLAPAPAYVADCLPAPAL